MNKKIVLITFLAAVTMSFAAGFIFSDVITVSLFDQQRDSFETITDVLERQYYYDVNDEAQYEAYIAQLDAIVEAYSTYFNDPYTRLDAYDLSQIMTQNYIGMGITFYFDSLLPVVSYVYYEAPAYQKLYPGDTLIGVQLEEDNYFEDMSSTDDVLALLQGDQYEEKTIIVKNADGIVRNETITYDEIPMTNVEVKQFNGTNVSYIRIHEFTPYVNDTQQGTAQAFKEALAYLEAHGLDDDGALIIDLRDNPGGSVSALHNLNFPSYPAGIIQQLIPYDTEFPAFQMIDNDGNIQTFNGGLSDEKPYEITVLVNANSASASEVLAAALQTQGYTVYGENTFGKHVYQNQYALTQINDMEYVLVYTEGIWTYKDGVTVEDEPIEVDTLAGHPYHMIERFIYTGTLTQDDVSEDLIIFQMFLNMYYDAQIREDGYFDSETETRIRTFQTEHGLLSNGVLNYETYKVMHDIYLTRSSDLTYDTQVNRLVELLT